MIKRGSIPYSSPSEFINTNICDVIGLFALKGVCPFERRGPLHIHPHLLNSVHKYTEIYDGIGLLALNLVVMFERGSTSYASPSELCSQIHRC